MKLVAQRVVRSTDHATGVNAYCYLHPSRHFFQQPPHDLGQGELSGEIVEVPPGGNNVRSYLEIVAPDETANEEITRAVVSSCRILSDVRQGLPWSLRFASVSFEFNLELSLVPEWAQELQLLLAYALRARSG